MRFGRRRLLLRCSSSPGSGSVNCKALWYLFKLVGLPESSHNPQWECPLWGGCERCFWWLELTQTRGIHALHRLLDLIQHSSISIQSLETRNTVRIHHLQTSWDSDITIPINRIITFESINIQHGLTLSSIESESQVKFILYSPFHTQKGNSYSIFYVFRKIVQETDSMIAKSCFSLFRSSN